MVWIHVAATGLYMGATAGLALFPLQRARRAADAALRRSRAAAALRVYDPLAIALLGAMVMTGAWRVTALKQALGTEYFAVFGSHLAWKLSLAFLVVMAGTYVCFGLGHRLVREEEWGEEIDERRLAGMLRRLNAAAWTAVALTAATVLVAVRGGA